MYTSYSHDPTLEQCPQHLVLHLMLLNASHSHADDMVRVMLPLVLLTESSTPVPKIQVMSKHSFSCIRKCSTLYR